MDEKDVGPELPASSALRRPFKDAGPMTQTRPSPSKQPRSLSQIVNKRDCDVSSSLRIAGRTGTRGYDCEKPIPPSECPAKKRCMMDLHPVPCGSWQDDYDARNAVYNRQLVVAAGVFVVTMIVVNRVGWVKGYPEITLF